MCLDSSIVDLTGQLGGRAVDLDTGEVLLPPGREEDGRGGLSMFHNLPAGQIISYAGGGLLKAKRAKVEDYVQKGGGKRGAIGKFSKGSRWRFMQKMGTINRSVLPVFVTLTYPDLYPNKPAEWYRQLNRMCKRFERKGWGAIARKEFEVRKSGVNKGKLVPHFHLLVWGIKDIEGARQFISLAWYQIVGSGDIRHLKAGTAVERLRSWKGVIYYVSKYMAKVQEYNLKSEYPEGVGRFWYVWNSEYIPWASIETYAASDREILQFFRYMRRYAHMQARSSNRSMAILCNNPDDWINKLL